MKTNRTKYVSVAIVGLGCLAIGASLSIFATSADLGSAQGAESSAASAAGEGDALAQLQTVFTSHCAQCHGDTKPEANLQLSEFNSSRWNDYDLLDELLMQIKEDQMPPDDAKLKLADADRKRVVELLETRLEAIEGSQLGGTLNRLTRREWCDTLEDLTGIEVEKPYELPIDSSHAMTRIGEHQLLTPLAMRQYQEVASRYVDEVIFDSLPAEQVYKVDLTKAKNQIGNTGNEAKPWGILSHNDRTIVSILSPVKTAAAEGEYDFTFDYYFVLGSEVDKLKKGELPKPITVDKNRHFGRFGDSSFGDNGAFKFSGEILSKSYTHDLDGKKLSPSTKEKFYRFDQPLRLRLVKEDKAVLFIVHGNGKGPRWVFTGVTIRGPLNKQYPVSHKRIFGDAPREADMTKCKEVLDSLATRLFRRPVDAKIMAPYYAIAKAEYNQEGSLFSATKRCMKAMLCSPYFIFKDAPSTDKLEGRMIATRLSYFLNNSMPDERLMNLAEEGKLADSAVRRAEAERLLADGDKSKRFIRLFVHQWLGLEKFDDFVPNAAYINPKQLPTLRQSMKEEPYAFFTELLKNDLSARNLIDSDFVMWDKELAKFYGSNKSGVNTKGWEGSKFNKLDLAKSSEETRHRLGGLVSMPVTMSMTTDGETTQPMLRGAWVIKQLFGKELEPLDSIPALEIDLSNVDKPKEILRLHKQDPSCASCHIKMDYMGLALENYDVMGRWQPNYLIPVLNEKNRFEIVTKDPVDSLAESPDGKPIDGVGGLKKHLLEREDEILRNLIEKLFAYAMGREVRYKDRPAIDRLLKTAKSNDYRLRDMILEIVASDSFIHR